MMFRGHIFWIVLLSFVVSGVLIYTLVFVFTGKLSWVTPEVKEEFDQPHLGVGSLSEAGKEDKMIISKDLPEKFELPPLKWVGQSFNNCGPATVSMVLQAFDIEISQDEVKEKLRTNPDDKNVFPHEIVDYIKTEHNLEAKLLYNGDIDLLKKLISSGFFVITENWMRPNEDIGHVAIVKGYDDERGVLIVDDSYLGSGILFKYESFDENQWKPFNREYIVVYKTEDESTLKKIIGDNWSYSLENSVERNRLAINENRFDMNA